MRVIEEHGAKIIVQDGAPASIVEAAIELLHGTDTIWCTLIVRDNTCPYGWGLQVCFKDPTLSIEYLYKLAGTPSRPLVIN